MSKYRNSLKKQFFLENAECQNIVQNTEYSLEINFKRVSWETTGVQNQTCVSGPLLIEPNPEPSFQSILIPDPDQTKKFWHRMDPHPQLWVEYR
jgi:hypothetical protein